MPRKSWYNDYSHKILDAEAALSHLKNGQTLFLGSGVGEPTLLTDTLAAMADQFRDIEVIHLAANLQESKLARPELAPYFRFNTFFLGQGMSDFSEEGVVDYTPMDIREMPAALRDGILLVDVALVQVAPPDTFGLCSLGVAVDATKAAVEHADLVIAEVNEHMPVTLGDSMVPVESIDFMVRGDRPLKEIPPPAIDPVSLTIGRHIARLIEDGMTLHFDRGPISSATMRYLDTRRDLGIHTDVITDDILRLIKTKAVSNRVKKIHKGKSVATMLVGTEQLYRAAHRNPYIEIHPIDYVNDPFVIGQYDDMVAVHTVQEMELTGMARVDKASITASHLPSSTSFIDGARRSKNGFAILALPSTTPDGEASRIVAASTGRGYFYARSKVDYVVTEYGVVHLFGLSIRERAIALIHIAHPKFRQELLEEAKKLKYVGPEQTVIPESGGVYPDRYEFTHTFKDDTKVFFRPVRPSDARRLQRLFYSLSPKARRLRYHGTIKALSNEAAQRMATVDYSQDLTLLGLVGPKRNRQAIAEGRYLYHPVNNMGEFDIVVHEKYQGRGIATFLANYLNKAAYTRGLAGVYAYVITQNEATVALLNKAWPTAWKHWEDGACTFVLRFPEEDIGRPKDSIIIDTMGSAEFSYGEDHPFNPARAKLALELIREQECLNEPWMRVEAPEIVPHSRLYESHDPDFIEAIEQTSLGTWRDEYLRYGIGTSECPVFPGLFDYVLLYCSATIAGVDLITEERANLVFNPLGGFHHSGRDHAEGFCYANDAILAIDLFLARGHRVAYIDIDAHHGNGVQEAYYSDDRVLTISLHESGKTLYPWGGFEKEIGEGIGTGYTLNVPLPEETDDEAYLTVFNRVVVPAVERFSPTVVVAVIGADTHRSDPLTHLGLSNNGMVEVMKLIRDFSHHLLLLGGGGYNMQATTRAWCRLWATANRIDALPDYLLVLGGAFLGDGGLQKADIVDMPYQVTGEKKEAILSELDRVARFHEEHTIPVIRKSR